MSGGIRGLNLILTLGCEVVKQCLADAFNRSLDGFCGWDSNQCVLASTGAQSSAKA